MSTLHAPVQAAARAAIDPAPTATCARPGCSTVASASLSFSYLEQLAVLDPLDGDPPPQAYGLCAAHAARTRPPKGWELCDRRPASVFARGAHAPAGLSTAGVLDLAAGRRATSPAVTP